MEFSAFGDLDEMFRQMREDQQAADGSVRDWQASVKPGDYVARSGPGFMIYSQILDDPEPRDASLAHYRFTRSYSLACPSGELGDLHVSTIEKIITADDFKAARERGWA